MKVWPKNEAMRKVLKHGVIAFPEDGPADWPDDTFTHRRIMDGDVTAEDPVVVKKASAPQPMSVKNEMKPDVGKV